MTRAESHAVISGVGRSAVGRRLGVDPWILTADAVVRAIADAGLTTADIDGVSTYPGAFWSTPGITGAGVDDVRSMLGLRLRWHTGGGELPGQLGSVVNAVLAVAGGLATHVVCFRTVWEATAQADLGSRSATMLAGDSTGGPQRFAREKEQWTLPYGVGYPCFGGLEMQRYMEIAGASREQLAQVSLVARHNASLNEAAIFREPLTLDDYLTARMISDPLCIYDCDVPVDGAIAVVVSPASAVTLDRSRAVSIEAIGSASGFDEAAAMMWSRTDLKPADVDVAQLYDGFSIYAIRWLEALGFCDRFEGARYVEGGTRIAATGELPLNTNGGQLSAGRLHGYGGLLEACLQLRGDAGAHQLGSHPEVAVVTSGAESFTSSLLLGGPR